MVWQMPGLHIVGEDGGVVWLTTAGIDFAIKAKLRVLPQIEGDGWTSLVTRVSVRQSDNVHVEY